MRLGALIPIAVTAAAVILSFLSLFAGHRAGFLEDYHIETLNVSRIGQSILDEGENSLSNHLPAGLNNIIGNIISDIGDDVDDKLEALIEKLGIHDFYSYHILGYCWGQYLPAAVPNRTLASNKIHKVVSGCSNRTALFSFDATKAVQESLNRSGYKVSLDDLKWPSEVEDVQQGLKIAARAVFVFYCIGIGMATIAFFTSLLGLFSESPFLAAINVNSSGAGFIALGIASALITYIMVKSARFINRYGKEAGVEAHRGGKFLAITWAATGCLLLASIFWCFGCVHSMMRKRRHRTRGEKSLAG